MTLIIGKAGKGYKIDFEKAEDSPELLSCDY